MDFNNLKNLGVSLGISYALEITSTLEDFEEFVIGQIKTRLDEVKPEELKYAFDENKSILSKVDVQELQNLKSYVKSNDERILKIKQNIANYMYHFNSGWALAVLEKELPDFYSIIMTDDRPVEFQLWFSDQITDIINQVNELFS